MKQLSGVVEAREVVQADLARAAGPRRARARPRPRRATARAAAGRSPPSRSSGSSRALRQRRGRRGEGAVEGRAAPPPSRAGRPTTRWRAARRPRRRSPRSSAEPHQRVDRPGMEPMRPEVDRMRPDRHRDGAPADALAAPRSPRPSGPAARQTPRGGDAGGAGPSPTIGHVAARARRRGRRSCGSLAERRHRICAPRLALRGAEFGALPRASAGPRGDCPMSVPRRRTAEPCSIQAAFAAWRAGALARPSGASSGARSALTIGAARAGLVRADAPVRVLPRRAIRSAPTIRSSTASPSSSPAPASSSRSPTSCRRSRPWSPAISSTTPPRSSSARTSRAIRPGAAAALGRALLYGLRFAGPVAARQPRRADPVLRAGRQHRRLLRRQRLSARARVFRAGGRPLPAACAEAARMRIEHRPTVLARRRHDGGPRCWCRSLNLLTPLFGIALMVHVHKQLSARAADRSPRPGDRRRAGTRRPRPVDRGCEVVRRAGPTPA